jgi:hypothetical protein
MYTQWCQTNFSSIEDVENCQNREGFRQKKLTNTLETGIFGVISEGQLSFLIRQIKSIIPPPKKKLRFWGANPNCMDKLFQARKKCPVSANVKLTAFI